jgi:predicted ThiF/HesA family dinucleotide-utilizing enzyme
VKREYHIVGIGTIGFPVAVEVFKNRADIIHLWDDDIIDENDVIYPKRYVGRDKVDIAKDILSKYKKDTIII